MLNLTCGCIYINCLLIPFCLIQHILFGNYFYNVSIRIPLKFLPELNDDEDVVLVLSDPGERVVTSSSLRRRQS